MERRGYYEVMTAAIDTLHEQAKAARKASRTLAASPTAARNGALAALASALAERESEILAANAKDTSAAMRAGMDEHITDRLALTPERLAGIAKSVRDIAALQDPVGEVIESRTLPNGLELERRRVPLGVIGVIYESRPNVTIDIAALCLKSGNAVILRGGKEAAHSNAKLAEIVQDAVASVGLPRDAIQFVSSADRSLVHEMLQMKDDIDLMVPRGGSDLVHMVAREAKMPAITGGIGVCHTYIDSRADVDMAVGVVVNAKVSRPTVCNALDTVIVHTGIADKVLPRLASELGRAGVEVRCDERALAVLRKSGAKPGASVTKATTEDFGKEFLALIASVAVVDSFDAALEHIARYGSGHSEAIITQDNASAERFLNEVDAAAVFHNASTRFNDGGEFGLGAEVAISTNKLHARGPMGLKEITSYKWVVRGQGQVRN